MHINIESKFQHRMYRLGKYKIEKTKALAGVFLHHVENNHFGPISQHHFQSSQERL